MDLDKIRAVFTDWPSELDVAKVPSHWASQAQAFFCAAQVLDEESKLAHQRDHAYRNRLVDEGDVMRQQTHIPAEFCLAFSLELAIKSALVRQGRLDELTSGEPLAFGNHNLHELAQQVVGLEIKPDELGILRWASEAVLNGKYPVSKKPSDAKNGVPAGKVVSALLEEARPLYKRLIEMACRRGDVTSTKHGEEQPQ